MRTGHAHFQFCRGLALLFVAVDFAFFFCFIFLYLTLSTMQWYRSAQLNSYLRLYAVQSFWCWCMSSLALFAHSMFYFISRKCGKKIRKQHQKKKKIIHIYHQRYYHRGIGKYKKNNILDELFS